MSVAFYAFFVTDCLADRIAEHDPGIFDRVVGVHIEISFYGKFHIKQPMSGKSVQHMIKKSDAGTDLGFSASVKGKRHCDIRFFCCPGDGGCPTHWHLPLQNGHGSNLHVPSVFLPRQTG